MFYLFKMSLNYEHLPLTASRLEEFNNKQVITLHDTHVVLGAQNALNIS